MPWRAWSGWRCCWRSHSAPEARAAPRQPRPQPIEQPIDARLSAQQQAIIIQMPRIEVVAQGIDGGCQPLRDLGAQLARSDRGGGAMRRPGTDKRFGTLLAAKL